MNEQVDPNRYYYARSNPVFYLDRLGLYCQLTPQWRDCLSRIFGFPVQQIEVHDQSVLPDLLTGGVTFTKPGHIFLPGKCREFWVDPELVLHEYYHVIDQWGTDRMRLDTYLLEGLRQEIGGGHGHRDNRFENEAEFFSKTHEQSLKDCLGCTPLPPEPPLFPLTPCPPGTGARTRGLGSVCN